jgi:hypothetical protein
MASGGQCRRRRQLAEVRLVRGSPAERLGIYLSPLRTVEDFRQLLSTALAAVSRGEIAPAEGARIVQRARARLRAVRRLARFERRLARETGPVRTPLG